MWLARGPATRIMPRHDRPGGELTAAMVSAGFTGGVFYLRLRFL